MVLIVGLGNPGSEYKNSRHNLGFMVVDRLQSQIAGFSVWQKETKFLAEISEGKIANQKVVLAKPQTFMNNSGKSVKLLIRKRLNKAAAELRRKGDFLLIIHDDIDIALGKIRLVKNRGAAGHKGVESVVKELETKNFVRFRVGIKPKSKTERQNAETKNLDEFVLESFSRDEKKIVAEVVNQTTAAIGCFLEEGQQMAMSRFNS